MILRLLGLIALVLAGLWIAGHLGVVDVPCLEPSLRCILDHLGWSV